MSTSQHRSHGELDLDAANPGAYQTFSIKFEPRLLEGEGIVATVALETGVTRGFTCFDTAKESLECQVNTFLHILQYLRMHLLESWILLLPLCQELIGAILADRLTFLLISVFAISERLIVEASSLLKHVFKSRSLGFAWVESILVCQ